MPSRTCALFASRRIQNNRAFLRDSPGSFDANARADEPACGERGSTMVEFAVTFLPFLLLILGLIQLLIIGFTAVGIQYAANRAARWASVGNITSRTSRLYSEIDARIREQIRFVGIDDSDISVSICPSSNRNCGGQMPGAARQFIVVTVKKPAMSIFGIGGFPVSAEVLMRNEPF